MKVVIIGGTGLIGSKLGINLRELGHDVITAAPNTGVNTVTGEGLWDALQGADVVVDVANSPSFEDKAVLEFFETSGKNLLAGELAAGVKHHIALSVVGTDRLQESGYFRGKQMQEKLIVNSGIPYSIVRSTQFFEFLPGIVASSAIENEVHLAPAEIRPIASDDVALALANVVTSDPINGIVEIAGPDVFSLPELVLRYFAHTDDPRHVKVDARARYFGALLGVRTLIPGDDARLSKVPFDEWITAQSVRLPHA